MQRAMAKQAEAERERRAKVIHAEGEAQAAERLSDASEIMTRSPFTLQLRYLQTISDISGENSSTISDISGENSSTVVFPLPVDLLRPFLERSDRERSDRERSDRESRD
jgi:regulator of protease activity HflC (stomatin/prohibitin superfamily)